MAVRKVQGRRDLAKFIAFPYRHYAADPLWVPPLRSEIRSLLSRRREPFFEHGDAEFFIAERQGRVAGRIAAITNALHNEQHGDRMGFFGFFESVDDSSVAGELLGAAASWARERGHDRLRGPVSYSVNHECGLLVDGFDTPPALMMAHNPPYYSGLLEQAGFRKAKDLWAFEIGDTDGPKPVLPDRAALAMERIGKRYGVTLRTIDLGRLDEEAERIRTVFNACWAGNWGFVPITVSEMGALAKRIKPIVNPHLVPIAEIGGETVGFGLALRDLNHVLRANRSGRTLPGVMRILWALYRKKKIPRARVLLMGVLPEHRGKGIDAMLFYWIWSRAIARGVNWGEASWMLEDNALMNNALTRMAFTHYKTYRLYERSL